MPPATANVSPTAAATTPNNTWMSPRLQPRSVVTCPISAHQNTKKVKLLSAMKNACMRNAPRSATADFMLVARSARANAKLCDRDVIAHPTGEVIRLPTIHRQCRCRAPENRRRHESRHAAPDHELPRQPGWGDQTVSQHE